MHLLPVLFFAVSVSLALSVGVRLLFVARRTGQTPELLWGIAASALALGVVLDAVVARVQPVDWVPVLSTTAQCSFGVASAGVASGTARIFRPTQRWAHHLASAIVVALIGLAVVLIVSGGPLTPLGKVRGGEVRIAYLAGYAIRLVTYAWLTVEAGSFCAMQRRGLRYGLADPVAMTQALLWGISSACITVGLFVVLILRGFVGRGVTDTAIGLHFFSLLGAVSSLSLYWGFFPTDALVRWAQRQGESPHQGDPP